MFFLGVVAEDAAKLWLSDEKNTCNIVPTESKTYDTKNDMYVIYEALFLSYVALILDLDHWQYRYIELLESYQSLR